MEAQEGTTTESSRILEEAESPSNLEGQAAAVFSGSSEFKEFINAKKERESIKVAKLLSTQTFTGNFPHHRVYL